LLQHFEVRKHIPNAKMHPNHALLVH
jgi:hypothetical protein